MNNKPILLFAILLFIIGSSGSNIYSNQLEEVKINAGTPDSFFNIFLPEEFSQSVDQSFEFQFQVLDPLILPENVRISAVYNDQQLVICNSACVEADGFTSRSITLSEVLGLVGATDIDFAILNRDFEGILVFDSTNPDKSSLSHDIFIVDDFDGISFDIRITPVSSNGKGLSNMRVVVRGWDPKVNLETTKISAIDNLGDAYELCPVGSCPFKGDTIDFLWNVTKTFPGLSIQELNDRIFGIIVEDTSSKLFSVIYTRNTYTSLGGNTRNLPLLNKGISGGDFTVDSFFDIFYDIDTSSLRLNSGINRFGVPIRAEIINSDLRSTDIAVDVVLDGVRTQLCTANCGSNNDRNIDIEWLPSVTHPSLTEDRLNLMNIEFLIYSLTNETIMEKAQYTGTFQVDSFFDIAYDIQVLDRANSDRTPRRGTMEIIGRTLNRNASVTQINAVLNDGSTVTICKGSCSRNGTIDIVWDTRYVFPSISASGTGNLVKSITIEDVNDPTSLVNATFQVDSFFDVFFDVTVDLGEYLRPINSTTPIIAKILDPSIRDDGIVIDLLISNGSSVTICSGGCSKAGDIYFEWDPRSLFPTESVDQVNALVDGFAIYNKNNLTLRTVIPSPTFTVDSFFDITYMISSGPFDSKYEFNDLIPVRVSFDPSLDPNDISLFWSLNPNFQDQKLCDYHDCFPTKGYLAANINLTTMRETLGIEMNSDFDPVISVRSISDPIVAVSYRYLDHQDNLDNFFPPRPLEVGWRLTPGLYEYRISEFASTTGNIVDGDIKIFPSSLFQFKISRDIELKAEVSRNGDICIVTDSLKTSNHETLDNDCDDDSIPDGIQFLIDGISVPLSMKTFSIFFYPTILFDVDGSELPLYKTLDTRNQMHNLFPQLSSTTLIDDVRRLIFTNPHDLTSTRVDIFPDGRVNYRAKSIGSSWVVMEGTSYRLKTSLNNIIPMPLDPTDNSIDFIFQISPLGLISLNLTEITSSFTTAGGVRVSAEVITDNTKSTGDFNVRIDSSVVDNTPTRSEAISNFFEGGVLTMGFGNESLDIYIDRLRFSDYTIYLEPSTTGPAYKMYEPITLSWNPDYYNSSSFTLVRVGETVGHELTHVVQQGNGKMIWTPYNIIPGDYFINATPSRTSGDEAGTLGGPSLQSTFKIIGDNTLNIFIDIVGDRITAGEEVKVEWKPFDAIDSPINELTTIDIQLINSAGTVVEVLAEKIRNTGSASIIISEQVGKAAVDDKYQIRVLITDIPGINGLSVSFSIDILTITGKTSSVTTITSDTTTTLTDQNTSSSPLNFPILGTVIALFTIVSIISIKQRKLRM